MHILNLTGLGFGLAMDAFAVSLASGAILREVRFRHALRIAFFFGLFQAIMPLLGGLAGSGLRTYVTAVSHWIVFAILLFIGGKMIYESWMIEDEEKKRHDPLHLKVLFVLALITSIDAFAVGISLALLRENILHAATVIGLVTFFICLAGVIIGDRIGHLCEDKVEIVGGFILIAIGTKILIQQLLAA